MPFFSHVRHTAPSPLPIHTTMAGLHNENFGTVGTQAAVIAGFTMTALVEMTVPPETWRPLKFVCEFRNVNV